MTPLFLVAPKSQFMFILEVIPQSTGAYLQEIWENCHRTGELPKSESLLGAYSHKEV